MKSNLSSDLKFANASTLKKISEIFSRKTSNAKPSTEGAAPGPAAGGLSRKAASFSSARISSAVRENNMENAAIKKLEKLKDVVYGVCRAKLHYKLEMPSTEQVASQMAFMTIFQTGEYLAELRSISCVRSITTERGDFWDVM
ncbi:hypothetical protein [Verminephrobacter aporrectodeae]|uniref:hypothetical protein n=1 Tax=Verminephrobacter aporrectodeae TaxID=1110389 RepID=UPI002237A4B4|nr:hypothetical protein [Verminephrobacter aporrectodeae]